MRNFFKGKWNIVIVLAILGAFVVGFYVGDAHIPQIDKVAGLSNKEPAITTAAPVDFSPFWKAWNTIDEKFPDASSITAQDRVYGAISGLMGSLKDPYSVFFGPADAKSFEDQIAGNFSGIGMEVGIKNNTLTVVAPLKDTPAYRAGIKPGDEVLKIDNTITSGLSIDDAVTMMRGDKGTTVTLTILRVGDKMPVEIKLVRDIINIPTLDTELRPDGIFVIRLYSFSANSASLFRDAMQKFAASGSNKLLLDLRGNPGGYLDAAVDISSWFLPAGKVVVTENYGNNKPADIYRSKGYNILPNSLKFVILIDGGSASASEIVAGAMQDQGRAKLVGAQSFGKGSVQEVVNVTSNTILKITVAKWLTPNGTSISEKGLTPDYLVEFTPQDIANKVDSQINKAVELLNQ